MADDADDRRTDRRVRNIVNTYIQRPQHPSQTAHADIKRRDGNPTAPEDDDDASSIASVATATSVSSTAGLYTEPTAYVPPSSRQEATLLRNEDEEDPPPAYTPSPSPLSTRTPLLQHGAHDRQQNYQTVAPAQIISANNSPVPQRMDSPRPGPSRSRSSHDKRRERRRGFSCRKFLFGLVAAALGLALLLSLVAFMVHRLIPKPGSEQPIDSPTRPEPSTTPVVPAPTPTVPNPSPPAVPSTSPKQPASRSSLCPNAIYTRTANFGYSELETFGFFEKELPVSQGVIRGKVIFMPSNATPQNMRINVTASSTDQALIDELHFGFATSSFTVEPPYQKRHSGSDACLSVIVEIYVGAATKLKELNMAGPHFSFDFGPGLQLSIDGETLVQTVLGQVISSEAASFQSRKMVIEGVSGSITGQWALLEMLSLTSRSADITVDILPKAAGQGDLHIAPAEFFARSISGAVTARYPIFDDDIPDRDYHVDVSTASGDVRGDFIHGNITKLMTGSGSIRARVLPSAVDEYPSNLVTDALSGTTDLELLSPFHGAGMIMSDMTSSHTSVSGSFKMKYPAEWEGFIQASTLSGSVKITGKNIDYLKSRLGSSQRVIAQKGDGNSTIALKTYSGSVLVTFPD